MGKTAIVEGLAQRIVAGDVPPGLLGSQLLELDLAALAAGCMMPGEFEERLKAVCNEVADSPRKIILFIDDIHNLVPNAAQQVRSRGDPQPQGDCCLLIEPLLFFCAPTLSATQFAERKFRCVRVLKLQ